MADVTLESLAARVAELERRLAEKDAPEQDWRSVVGMFANDEVMAEIVAEGAAYRESLRLQAEAEADAKGLPR